MNSYDAILFDLDGTFIDTAPDFVVAGNRLRAANNLAELPDHSIREQVSNGAAAVTQRCLNILPEDPAFESSRQQLLKLYDDVLGQHSQIYAGLSDLVNKLHQSNKRWGIVTNKPLQFAKPLLDHMDLTRRCDILICPDHVSNKKPDPESLILASEKINTPIAKTIYVGDHERDIIAGNAAGMLTIAVGYGYISENDNPAQWGADHVAPTTTELCNLLCSLTDMS